MVHRFYQLAKGFSDTKKVKNPCRWLSDLVISLFVHSSSRKRRGEKNGKNLNLKAQFQILSLAVNCIDASEFSFSFYTFIMLIIESYLVTDLDCPDKSFSLLLLTNVFSNLSSCDLGILLYIPALLFFICRLEIIIPSLLLLLCVYVWGLCSWLIVRS